MPRNNDWSDGTWFMWFKFAMGDAGLFNGTGRDFDDAFKVQLHVGFVTVVEEDWMVENLKAERLDWSEFTSPARSKISKTNEVIKPIDRVAHRVSPPEFKENTSECV